MRSPTHNGEPTFDHEHLLLEVHLQLELAKVDDYTLLKCLKAGQPPHLLLILPLLHAVTHYHGRYDLIIRFLAWQGGQRCKARELLVWVGGGVP
jgi:hypothetical protein